jgi:predicted RNA-binding Zn-ribbon protein involved in translation (DUF1610 family)
MSNARGQQLAYSAPRSSLRHTCPECSEQVHRVRRRFIDRVISLFKPVQRYRCLSPSCGWEGNMAMTPDGKAGDTMAAGSYPADAGGAVGA